MRKNRCLFLILPLVTFVLELLPYGAVLNFANPDGEPFRKTFSYFSTIPYGYANFAPLLTAILTCIILVMLLVYVIKGNDRIRAIAKKLLYGCAVLSLCPLLTGIKNFSLVGALISVTLLAEMVLIQYAEAKTRNGDGQDHD